MGQSKLPQNAKLAFRGELWDVYQWPQKMFDGSTAIFEGLKSRRNGVKVIALSGNKIIMTKEERPDSKKTYYTLIGGQMDENEEPIETGKRELLEEAGLESNNWEQIEVIDVLNYPRIEFYIYLFIARNCVKIAEPRLDNGEKIETIEVTFEQFIENISSNIERFGSFGYSLLNNKQKLEALKSKIGL
jgi:ADP-ribose pyrophosphatase